MKRSRILPLVLLVYLVGISIYSWPGRNPEISYLQYGLTIGITLVCIIALTFFLKKRDKFRDENRNNRNKKE